MLQTSINNVKILQRSATLHRIVILQINKITVTGGNGQRKRRRGWTWSRKCWCVKIEI